MTGARSARGGVAAILESGVASVQTRAKWLVAVLVLNALLEGVEILHAMHVSGLIRDYIAGEEVSQIRQAIGTLVGSATNVAAWLLLIPSVVLWLRWQHRAYGNLAAIGSQKTRWSPGWSVGYWFIPILHYFRPYQVTKELWTRSALANRLESIREQPPATLVSAWWFLWLVVPHSGILASMRIMRAKTAEAALALMWMPVTVGLFSILLCLVSMKVVRSITALQMEMVRIDAEGASDEVESVTSPFGA